ncbi:MAG: hypothetical protein K0R05_1081 [Anaerocolumna sp.]|jgi:hypothetical protein|nr:hypothetical protein [Anaerocolumna sp.]
MFQVGSDWNPRQAQLKESISNTEKFTEAMELCLYLHGIVHTAEISNNCEDSYYDELMSGLTKEAFTVMPTIKDVTIVWNLWHITRIEDLTANILIQEKEQVLNEDWLKRLGVTVTDTGNAMTDGEILDLSNSINLEELRNYRKAVGVRTRSIVNSLAPADIKRKVRSESIARILEEGGVTKHPDSLWLLDFWGRKNVAGILLMPITRHQIGHLNDSMKLKKKLMRNS